MSQPPTGILAREAADREAQETALRELLVRRVRGWPGHTARDHAAALALPGQPVIVDGIAARLNHLAELGRVRCDDGRWYPPETQEPAMPALALQTTLEPPLRGRILDRLREVGATGTTGGDLAEHLGAEIAQVSGSLSGLARSKVTGRNASGRVVLAEFAVASPPTVDPEAGPSRDPVAAEAPSPRAEVSDVTADAAPAAAAPQTAGADAGNLRQGLAHILGRPLEGMSDAALLTAITDRILTAERERDEARASESAAAARHETLRQGIGRALTGIHDDSRVLVDDHVLVGAAERLRQERDAAEHRLRAFREAVHAALPEAMRPGLGSPDEAIGAAVARLRDAPHVASPDTGALRRRVLEALGVGDLERRLAEAEAQVAAVRVAVGVPNAE